MLLIWDLVWILFEACMCASSSVEVGCGFENCILALLCLFKGKESPMLTDTKSCWLYAHLFFHKGMGSMKSAVSSARLVILVSEETFESRGVEFFWMVIHWSVANW